MSQFDEHDERCERHEQQLDRLAANGHKLEVTLTRLDEKMAHVEESICDILKALQRGYVTTAEFDPVRRIVYGLVGTILLGVVGAVLALVLK